MNYPEDLKAYGERHLQTHQAFLPKLSEEKNGPSRPLSLVRRNLPSSSLYLVVLISLGLGLGGFWWLAWQQSRVAGTLPFGVSTQYPLKSRKAYSLAYNVDRKMADFVVYRVQPGPACRSSKGFDPEFQPGDQRNSQPGMEMGSMVIPSLVGDQSGCDELGYYTVKVPITTQFRSSIRTKIANHIEKIAAEGRVWVVFGPVWENENPATAVPSNYFFLIVREKEDEWTNWALIVPNHRQGYGDPTEYQVSLAELEHRSGHDFFTEPGIGPAVADPNRIVPLL